MILNIHSYKRASKVIGMLAAIMFFCFSGANAQQENNAGNSASNIESNKNYDPIAAMLDSLVTLNYIQRLNFAASGTQQNNFQPYEIPTYADDIYTKRISKIQSPIELVFNQQVKEYIDLYAVRKRALTERMMGLSQLYFPLYEQILDQNNLPIEFKYLSIVESALNATAVSRVGATGLWQFMLNTGKMYNLKVNSYIDERRDPVKSTEAACQYFKDMYDIYHDWLLVIASYNCGAGNVNKAIARSGGKTNFWEISPYLPRETRGYVPAFVAVTYLMNYPAEHNLNPVPPVISFHEADTVLVNQKVALRDVAEAIDAPYDLLTYLNPVYKKGIVPDMDEPQVLRLPVNKVYTYISSLEKIFQSSAEPSFAQEDGSPVNPMEYVTKLVKKYHTVKKGERMSSIADKYNCSIGDIKRWNKTKSVKVFKGQRLLVYEPVKKKVEVRANSTEKSSIKIASKVQSHTGANQFDASATASTVKAQSSLNKSTSPVSAPSKEVTNASKFIWHVVEPGDTLWNIAQRYNCLTVKELKEINNLSTNNLKPGTKLKVKVQG